ncbi:hypothetical protein J6590_011139 [Homalodisca vitripennis]|nr:hypothetical protein J6590_011139 [Homalodisca vitripennis]
MIESVVLRLTISLQRYVSFPTLSMFPAYRDPTLYQSEYNQSDGRNQLCSDSSSVCNAMFHCRHCRCSLPIVTRLYINQNTIRAMVGINCAPTHHQSATLCFIPDTVDVPCLL